MPSGPGPAGFLEVLHAGDREGVRQVILAADVAGRVQPNRNDFRRHESHDRRHHFVLYVGILGMTFEGRILVLMNE